MDQWNRFELQGINLPAIGILIILLLSNCSGKKEMKEIVTSITAEEMMDWTPLEKGKASVMGDMLVMEETDGSDGFFLISSGQLTGDYQIDYDVKALSESSVLINLLNVTDTLGSDDFALPRAGSSPQEIWDWRSHLRHYNLTFNNRSHGITPFFYKNHSPLSRGFYQKLSANVMEPGQWFHVSIVKKGTELKFMLNNNTYFDIMDYNPLDGGRLIFRVSGTTGENTILAKAAIKNLQITSWQ